MLRARGYIGRPPTRNLRLIDLLDIRYVRLGTRDLDAADRFAREVVGLEFAREEAGAR